MRTRVSRGGVGISQSEMTEGVRPGRQPSPSRLRRATSPERERLWQGRKVCSLTAGFFLPLTNEDETCPLCQGLSLRESCRRRRLRGFVPEAPSPSRLRRATSPERERLWQRRKVYRLSADFFLPLTNEDETCPLCQGRPLRGSWHSRQAVTEGVRPGRNPLRHGFAVPPLPKGRGFGKGGKFMLYRSTCSVVNE